VNKSNVRLGSVFLLSVASIAYEIAVTRSFSVGSWSNFGAMVISIALLGFGIAGTFLTFVQKHVRANPDAWLFYSALLSPPTMMAGHILAQLIPFNPILITTDATQVFYIAAYYLVYSVPFIVGAFFIGVSFIVLSKRIHELYFWNMAGSGLGGFFVLGCMYVFPPDTLVAPILVIAGVAGLLLCFSSGTGVKTLPSNTGKAVLVIVSLAGSLVLLLLFGKISVSDFKSVSYVRKFPEYNLDYYSYSPLGEMHVYSSSYFHFAPGLSDNASNTLADMPKNAFKGLYIDGGGPIGIMRKLSKSEEAYIDYLPMSVAYECYGKPSVFVVDLGGGESVFTALHHDANKVTVVEPNADIIRLMKDTKVITDFNGNILKDPRVRVLPGEPRAFGATTKERFDIAELSLIDSVGLSQTGGYPVVENFTYTAEGFSDYMKCLRDSGMLSVTVWNRLNPPRNFPRLLSTLVRSLELQGVEHPEKRIFVFSMLLQTATVLVKKSDFMENEIDKLRKECERLSFDVSYYPGNPDRGTDFEKMLRDYDELFSTNKVYTLDMGEGKADGGNLLNLLAAVNEKQQTDEALVPSDLYHYMLTWLLAGKSEELFAKYVFDIRPATDDRPYYTAYLKTDRIGMFLGQLNKISEEWGYLVLIATLLISLIAAVCIISMPVIGRWKELFLKKRGTAGVIIYYGCLGLGYMLVEMCLIQKLVYFLEDPVFSLSIVLTAMLVISGIGSIASRRLASDPVSRVRIACAGIIVSLLFYAFGLTPLTNLTLGAPFAVKVLLSIVFIAPASFFMGMPFPTGLAALSSGREGLVPWAWGMNGALSVTGSVFARLLSVSYGFLPVLVCAMVLYAIVGIIFPVNAIAEREGAKQG
jgi:spermidine synthase